MNWVTVLGLAAAFCTTIGFLPQVIKTLRTRRTRDISLVMYLVLVTGVLLWFIYGFIIGDLPLILANGATLALASVVLAMKLRNG